MPRKKHVAVYFCLRVSLDPVQDVIMVVKYTALSLSELFLHIDPLYLRRSLFHAFIHTRTSGRTNAEVEDPRCNEEETSWRSIEESDLKNR